MINLAVQHLANQLNQYLKRTYDLAEDVVVISNLLELDGSSVPNVNNKIVILVTNIGKENIPQRQVSPYTTSMDGEQVMLNSLPLHLNLHVMMVANFNGNNYSEALKFISSTINFFQRRPLFNHQITPDLDKQIEKLTLDIENTTIQDLSNLWSSLGGKYRPSVLYKIRMIASDGEEIISSVPVIKKVENYSQH